MSSRQYFAQVAGDWDRLRAGFFSTALRDTALRLAGLAPGGCPGQITGQLPGYVTGQTAADLGAGTGFITEALLLAGLSVACVDQSPEMLSELRARFAASGRIKTFAGKAEDLPLPDASVDFVFANMFLHHVDDPGRAIAEMARIVRPGGRVVITDLDRHDHGFLLTEHHDRWPGFTRADVTAWLKAAGLAVAQVDCAGQDCCANSCGDSSAESCAGSSGDCCANSNDNSCADSCAGQASARISIFAAHATRPLCALRADQADPLAVGRLARSFWDAQRPLLCAEAVLLGVSQGLGVASPLIPRLATGFCSGLSRSCGPCGAFMAGVMALGLVLGRDSGRDDLDETYGPAQEYREYFLEHFGSLSCREITGHDLGSPEGLRAYRQEGLKGALCGPLLEAAAAQVVRILAERLLAEREVG